MKCKICGTEWTWTIEAMACCANAPSPPVDNIIRCANCIYWKLDPDTEDDDAVPGGTTLFRLRKPVFIHRFPKQIKSFYYSMTFFNCIAL